MKYNMADWGFTHASITEKNLYPGRVISQSKNLYKIVTEVGELFGEVTGKWQYNAASMADYPVVGDFVLLDRQNAEGGNASIQQVLERKSIIIRKMPGQTSEAQAIASNIDTVFICMSLNQNFNVRRLERYLAMVWESGANPVVILTKADLCEDREEKLFEVNQVAIGVDILVTSRSWEESKTLLQQYIFTGQTVAFIGSSGVGKSTLINMLLGRDSLDTAETGENDKGRHTTTRRELMLLPQGGCVVDTPGMRELGLEQGDLSQAFSDIEELSLSCRFRDCLHQEEPGCAVRAAIESGELQGERLLSYQKLQKELKYAGMNARQIENEKITTMMAPYGGMKNVRKMIKEKNKR